MGMFAEPHVVQLIKNPASLKTWRLSEQKGMHVAIVVIISNSVSEGSPFSDRLIRFGQEHGGHLACVLLELE